MELVLVRPLEFCCRKMRGKMERLMSVDYTNGDVMLVDGRWWTE